MRRPLSDLGKNIWVLFTASTLAAGCSRPIDYVATPDDAALALVDAGGARETGAPDGSPNSPSDAAVPEASADSAVNPIPRFACSNGAQVMLLTAANELLSFDPATDKTASLGTLPCTGAIGNAPGVALAVDDDGLVFVLANTGDLALLDLSAATCDSWTTSAAPLTPGNGAGLTITNSADPQVFLGVDDGLFYTSDVPMFDVWTGAGNLASATDFTRALLGTGDGRLFGVIAPGTATAYRVTSLDPNSGAAGATVLVPSTAGSDPAGPAGFALWADTLLVFTQRSLRRYDFASGVVTAPEILNLSAAVVAASSPPCASTL